MREFNKKYFLETLIQLTILANLFRENSRLPWSPLDNRHFHRTASRRLLDNIDNLEYDLNSNLSLLETTPFNYRSKLERENYDLREDLKRLSRNTPLLPSLNWQRYFVLPSSFYSNTNNHKGGINLSDETRILLNSIEFNNQLSKEVN